ncbi:hypothetical protein BD324DRAFT_639190 [Kockovaella imperatae]|uniref:Mitochondrial import inner membrane translocase subunit Tim21 n=1 Tax=Kockovaella imperatae TaxID=4999 RepID=A0A1Y1U9C6_9TREE|nr:hypothetical protein BD324DRAFT_639190 [Kockovaella imperatae]ORX33695.1 hypothetical protein BD324DRAFT_639190 [Kockovaella imperatae]
MSGKLAISMLMGQPALMSCTKLVAGRSAMPLFRITYQAPAVSHSAGTSWKRTYATHRDLRTDPSLDASPRVRTGQSNLDGRESVGPFPLGVGPSGRNKTWKSWKELGIKGKLGRTVRQTGNLGVILFGGGLFILLTLSLTTELFARNSPSVLYSQAVDKIRQSDALDAHLLPPLTFTHSPTPAAPVRGSTPVAHTLLRHPSSGRDHMIITFWVHGRGRNEPEPLHWAKSSWHLVLTSLDDAARYLGFIDGGASLFTGSSEDASMGKERNIANVEVDTTQSAEDGSGWLGSLLGGFSGLRNGSNANTRGDRSGTATRGLPPPGTYKVGEVKGDYVKNANGQYQLLSLTIDVPSSSASYPGRAVVFWAPEADREGLISMIGGRGR